MTEAKKVEVFDLFEKFDTDRNLELDGVWVDIGPTAAVKVARYGNDKYKEIFGKLTSPYKLQMRNNTLDEKVAEGILIKSSAAALLKDWKGVFVKGKEMPFSVTNAEEVMRALPDFKALVDDISNDIAHFKEEEVEDASKNS